MGESAYLYDGWKTKTRQQIEVEAKSNGCVDLGDSKPIDIRWASQQFPEIEKLTISIHPDSCKKGFKRTIRFKKIKQLKMRYYDKFDSVESFPIVFDQLDELEYHCYWTILMGIGFAGKNNLKKLKLYGGYEPMYGNHSLMEIVNTWPNLEEISLQFDDVDEVIVLTDKLKSLKRIEIQDVADRGRTEYFVELPSKLGSEWKVDESKDNDIIIITKT